MKKCLFILVFMLSFFLTITYCYASDDMLLNDINTEDELLKSDHEEEKIIVNEKIEEKKDNELPETLKEILYHNEPYMTRGNVSNPLDAKALTLRIFWYGTYEGIEYSNNFYIYANLTSLNIGDKYILHLTRHNSNQQNFDTYITPINSDYFTRGYEVLNEKLHFNPNPDSYTGFDCYFDEDKSYLYSFIDNLPNVYYLEIVEYEEPLPTPQPTPEPEPDHIVSWNSVSENLISIENQIIEMRKDIDSFKSLYVSNNAVVSNNIIRKRISEYTVSESIGLITLLMGFCAGLVYLIHKSIYRWR